MRKPHRDAIVVTTEGSEYEQHEPMGAVDVVTHEGSRVPGGAWPMRTNQECPSIGRGRQGSSIRDADLSHLSDMMVDPCGGEPLWTATVWEPTRLGRAVLIAAIADLKDQGEDASLFFGPPALMRMAWDMEYDHPRHLGRTAENGNRRALAFCELA